MKIGFDAKRAIQNNTGLGNYSRYVVEILSKYYPENSYFLFAPKDKQNPRLNLLQSACNVFFRFPQGLWKKFSSFWRVSAVKNDLKKNQIDIFHGLSNELPVRLHKTGIKSIVTIHDLIFLRYPEYYPLIDRNIYRLKFGYACRKANKIIAISECTKRDIISFFHIPEKKIKVIYQGCHPNFALPVSDEKKKEVVRKYQLPDQFLLYVGSIESRKNLLLVTKALLYTDKNIQLVAIGKKTNYQIEVERFVKENNLSGKVRIINDLPFEDLPACYQLAKIFIYPSFFEGFGIPLIEALSSGVPVIAATGSCLEEAGGPDSVYIDPLNEKELAEAISKVWNDPVLSKQMAGKGKIYVQRFSEEKIAKNIMEAYNLCF